MVVVVARAHAPLTGPADLMRSVSMEGSRFWASPLEGKTQLVKGVQREKEGGREG